MTQPDYYVTSNQIAYNHLVNIYNQLDKLSKQIDRLSRIHYFPKFAFKKRKPKKSKMVTIQDLIKKDHEYKL